MGNPLRGEQHRVHSAVPRLDGAEAPRAGGDSDSPLEPAGACLVRVRAMATRRDPNDDGEVVPQPGPWPVPEPSPSPEPSPKLFPEPPRKSVPAPPPERFPEPAAEIPPKPLRKNVPEPPPAKDTFSDLALVAQPRAVPRGERIHVLDAIGPTVYAFVSNIEGAEGQPWEVKFECVDARWMDASWQKLMSTAAGARLFRLFDGKPFEMVYPKLGLSDLRHLYLVYAWFLGVSIDSPVLQGAAPVSFFTVILPPDDRLVRPVIKHCAWYELRLEGGARADEAYAGDFVEWGATPDEDVRSVRRVVTAAFRRVPASGRRIPYETEGMERGAFGPSVIQGGLKALHFPQIDPLPAGADANLLDDDAPPPAPPAQAPHAAPAAAPRRPRAVAPSVTALARRAGRWFAGATALVKGTLHDVVQDVVGDLTATLSPQPAFALPGGFALPGRVALPGRLVPPDLGARPEPLAYTGSPLNIAPWAGLPTIAGAGIGAAGSRPVLNPMARLLPNHAHQPFLGTLNIGQGHCTMFVNHDNHVIAYFDFGYATDFTVGTAPAAPTSPCLCRRPLIILSHWDSDHWAMVRREHHALTLRWLAPQQHMGTASLHVIARVLQAGGQFNLWLAGGGGAGSHMRFPWGFVERANGPTPLDEDSRNDSGLVAWVCVKDQIGGAEAPANNAAAAVPAAAANVAAAAPAAAAGIVNFPNVAGIPAGWPAHLGLGAAIGAAPASQVAQTSATAAYASAVAAAMAAPVPAIAAACQAVAQAVATSGGTALAAAAVARNVANSAVVALAAAIVAAGAAPPANHAAWVAAVNAQRVAVANETLPLIEAAVNAVVAANGLVGHAAHRAIANAAADVLSGAAAPGLGDVAAVTHIGATPPVIVAADSPAARTRKRRNAVKDMLFGIVNSAVNNPPALALPPPHPAIPTVVGNPAPFTTQERYVLLTGDANYSRMPTQTLLAAGTQTPIVVGLLATHHGSNRVDGSQIESYSIPWAGTSAEVAVARVAQTVAARPGTVIEMAVAAATRWGSVGTAAAIDAAAVAAANGATPVANGATAAVIGALAAVAADANAAAIVAAVSAATPPAVRYAAAAVCLVERVRLNDYAAAFPAIVANEPAAVASAAVAGCTAQILGAAAADHANIINAAVAAALALGAMEPNAISPYDLGRYCLLAARHVYPMPLAPVVGLVALSQAAEAHVAAAGAMAPLIGGQVVQAMHPGALYATPVAGALFGLQPRFVGVSALLDCLYARRAAAVVATAAAIPAVVGAFPQTNAVASIADWAAVLGAEAGAAAALNVEQLGIRAATSSGYLADPVYPAVAGTAGGRIAYSYGLNGTGHCHPAAPGPMGHPHPIAIAKYRSRGWRERRNTVNTAASLQPDASPHGHIALGWENIAAVAPVLAVAPVVAVPALGIVGVAGVAAVPGIAAYEGPLRPGAALAGHIQWNCANCARAFNFVV
ncbi:hypothetical protein [Sorangium sp. So ce362]|uniref:hypothetical protein n=1 Tax=Sorangium sp. So ce362 TaxID=3133303 RepID=UPI003F60F26F